MNTLINEFKSNVTILTFLLGSGVLVTLYKFIKNKIFKKELTYEDVKQINKSLSSFVKSIYRYFNGKTKKAFEGLSEIKGI